MRFTALYPPPEVGGYKAVMDKTQTLRLIAYDDFTQMTTPSPNNISPLGEEIGDVFDFDISW